MNEQKGGRDFGTGTFLGDNGQDFFSKPIEVQVEEMGWSHACPVVDEVVSKHGAEWTLKRYAECNFVYGVILETAQKFNPNLYQRLTEPVKRMVSEVPGRSFNMRFIPQDFPKEMSPLSTPWGYALPRVIIEEMGRGENNKDRTELRILRALSIIESGVKKSKSPVELLVRTAEMVTHLDADPKTVLSHVLSQGILEEEGTKIAFGEIKRRIGQWAPNLKKTYDSMTSEERIELGIINF